MRAFLRFCLAQRELEGLGYLYQASHYLLQGWPLHTLELAAVPQSVEIFNPLAGA